MQKCVTFVKKNEDKHAEDKNYCNARDHCHCAEGIYTIKFK